MFGSEISRHGWIAMPTTPVISPPTANVIFFGKALEKSYDGLTTLAARLHDTVASTRATIAMITTTGLENRAASWAGSQIASPGKSSCAPEVVKIAISAMNDIVVGRPRSWPRTCWRCPLLKRVKSGMFSESVDQNAIMAIRAGANTFQKSPPQPSFDGADRIGPTPSALIST